VTGDLSDLAQMKKFCMGWRACFIWRAMQARRRRGIPFCLRTSLGRTTCLLPRRLRVAAG
jgi:hypothetical protein